jgi:hypothetical protein
MALPLLAQRDPAGDEERITLEYGRDNNIRIEMDGRGGNLELISSAVRGEGYVLTNYQKGSGFVQFDRDRQVLQTKTRMAYTLNRVSNHVQKVAPYMWFHIPAGAELDFDMDLNSVGYGSLDFRAMDINQFRLWAKYGDVDVNFPTRNESIVRGTAKFGMLAGDLEITNLGNLSAAKVRINGGAGEVEVHFGPQLFQNMDVRLDLDIGELLLRIPRGTHVRITGTSRNLSDYGLKKVDRRQGVFRSVPVWETEQYSDNSPLLDIRLTGPMGDLDIRWE